MHLPHIVMIESAKNILEISQKSIAKNLGCSAQNYFYSQENATENHQSDFECCNFRFESAANYYQ